MRVTLGTFVASDRASGTDLCLDTSMQRIRASVRTPGISNVWQERCSDLNIFVSMARA